MKEKVVITGNSVYYRRVGSPLKRHMKNI